MNEDLIKFDKLGHVVMPVDGRDFQLGHVQAPAEIPVEYKPDKFFQLVPLMQGHEPACGGFSLAKLLNYLRLYAPSPRFAFMAEKSIDTVNPPEDGTTLRTIGAAAKNLGVCSDSLVVDDISLPASEYADLSKASDEAKTNAGEHKEDSYFFLDDLSFEGIKQAIFQNGAVIIAMQVGNEWWTPSWNAADILPLKPPAEVVSGHFIVAGAYEADKIWVINSWSDKWGDKGFAYFGADYVPHIMNGLALKTIPRSVQTALKAGQIAIAQEILADLKLILEKDLEWLKTKVASQPQQT